jgi:soluble lytic murein transglycosylase-like protein
MKKKNPVLIEWFLLCGLLVAPAAAAVAGAAAGLETPPPGKVSGSNKSALKPMIDGIAKRHGVDKDLVHAVIAAESGYDARAVSPAGAIGLMQVMPATAADYGVASAGDLFDPETNVKVGTRHLKRLITKYRSIGHAVAAYNAGEGALEANRAMTYPETRRYAVQVIEHYRRNKGKAPLKLREIRIPARSRIQIPSVVGKLDPGRHKPEPGGKSMFVLEWER